ncbi:luciferase family protein [Nonomuraea sp. NPDC005650]|uniref:luciferase domain-containing protein n=1 Tax=Nonomuraea sp. NPDC005650 TaxID=3157045 RepID=UPI0033B747BB
MTVISARRRSTGRRGPYVARAVTQLLSWPALELSDTRRGVAFAVRGIEILRLTGADEVRLRLTEPAIGRLEPYLRDCEQVQTCADPAWVALRLEAEPDLDLLLALTSVAIKAHASEVA